MELPELPTQKQRLRWAASRRGCDKAAQLHRLLEGRMSESAVRHHFNGTRPISVPAARLYEGVLNVPWYWLVDGRKVGLAGIAWQLGGSAESPPLPAAGPTEALTDVELVERAAAAVDTLIALAPPHMAARMQQHRPQITGDLFNLYKSWCAGDVAVGGVGEGPNRDVKRR